MHARETCPQIEIACGDSVTSLVLRHLEPLSDEDNQRLRDFAHKHHVQWWLQPKGPDTVHLMDAASEQLAYSLDEFGITLPFKPTDFTQVNPHINRVLVSRALRLLDPQKNERVIDWFCGLGNFTLPLATLAKEVLGIEGSEALVARSRENYALNQQGRGVPLAPTAFVARNLFDMTPELLIQDGVADKWLVDPPREGAFALAKAVADLNENPDLRQGWTPPQRIVYVSCNPATLARDAGLLVNLGGYRCTSAGAVNMFPHTAHVESMAVFDLIGARQAKKRSLAAPFFVGKDDRKLFAFTAKNAQQSQQALEDVDDVQVQGQRSADVIGFTAVHDLLEVIQHVGAEDGNGQHGNHNHAGGRLGEHIDDAAHEQHDDANHQPFVHARQIAFDDGGQTGHQEEHACRAAKGCHHQVCAVFKAQHHGNHA
jgi:hypothetical protein